MMVQMVMQQGQVSGSSSGKDSESSFQDMMNQKQDVASSAQKDTSQQQPSKTEQPQQDGQAQQTGQEADTPVTEVSDEVRQVLAAMVFQQYVPQANVGTQQTAETVAAVPVAGAAAPQAAVQELAAAVPQQAAQQTVVPQAETAGAAVQTAQQAVSGQNMTEAVQQAAVPQENVQPQAVQQAQTQNPQQQSAGEQNTAMDTAGAKKTEEPSVSVAQQEQPLFGEVETVPVKVGEATPKVNTEAPDMEKQLADTIQANLKTAGDKVEVQLEPANLGRITIEMVQHDGKLGLVIYAESAKTTSLLAQHAGNLGALLEDRSGQVVQIQVQQQEQQPQPQYDGHNQQNQQQEQEQHPQQSKAEQDSFLGQLRLGLTQLEAL